MHEFTPPSVLPRVLLAEDHDRLRRMQVRFLSRTFAVDFASTGEEAVEMARERDYVAVVIDRNLPGALGGLGVMRALRRMPRHRHTPLVATTEPLTPDERDTLTAAGFDFSLARPFRWDTFLDVLRHAVYLGASGDSVPFGVGPLAPVPASVAEALRPNLPVWRTLGQM